MTTLPMVVATLLVAALGAPCLVRSAHAAAAPAFRGASPVWPAGREKEKNLTVGYRAVFNAGERDKPVLRLTASTLYRAFCNGEFLGHGPARGPHGFFRVDEWDLTPHLRAGDNLVAIEVAGYNVNSYYLIDQPSFLQAEIVSGDRVLAATRAGPAANGQAPGGAFEAGVVKERVQKVQRYSFQRPFSEVYRLAPGYDRWRREPLAPTTGVTLAVQPSVSLLARRVPYPDFERRLPVAHVSSGKFETGLKVDRLWKDRSLTAIGPQLGGYPEQQLETVPSLELQTVRNKTAAPVNRPWVSTDTLAIEAGAFHIVDLGCNLSGFIGAQITCRARARLFFTFDEILSNDDVDFKRLGCVNIIALELEPGAYVFESFEPYTLRYLKVFALEGECDVRGLYLREYVNPDATRAHFAASDERLNRLYAAARETFRQNAVDIFMDCPSRERAGWLCDSFFTARAATDLSGDTRVEKNFLENYLLPAKFQFIPEGMLPMCYPADHNDGVFIPNWALWFVVELEEYAARSGDREMVEALRARVLKLFEYLKQFRNEDGLLEKLPSWVFIEWSAANSFVQDVNYPSNMLYAKALAAAAKLYSLPDLAREAERLRGTIRRQSFDGEFFVDNALRRDGRLQLTRNRTEVCQYFAFFFGVATPQNHPRLWSVLVSDFGPQRKASKAYPEIHPANAFVGNVLRLELLSHGGRGQQILDESIGYLLYMADRTGTLWENDGAYASCDHGFASHAARVLFRDVVGLHGVDAVNKVVGVRFTDLKLDWCEGVVPTRDGRVGLRWWKDGNQVKYRLSVPGDYRVEVSNLTERECVRVP